MMRNPITVLLPQWNLLANRTGVYSFSNIVVRHVFLRDQCVAIPGFYNGVWQHRHGVICPFLAAKGVYGGFGDFGTEYDLMQGYEGNFLGVSSAERRRLRDVVRTFPDQHSFAGDDAGFSREFVYPLLNKGMVVGVLLPIVQVRKHYWGRWRREELLFADEKRRKG